MNTDRARHGRGSEGFALILAILSLLLLTFLGLTLATTTSTELQIATNYRWSQQARYNAEAGLDAGKVLLRDIVPNWASILPLARVGVADTWTATSAPPSLPLLPVGVPAPVGNRHWENQTCDAKGGKAGYGAVLNANAPVGLVQTVSAVFGQGLNGTFTLWVRRGVVVNSTTGLMQDDPNDSVLILTSEGTAPFLAASVGGDFERRNQAVAVMELTLLRGDDACEAYKAQAGLGIAGTGFAACAVASGGHDKPCGAAVDSFVSDAMGQAARNAGGAASAAFGSGAAGCLQSNVGVI